MSQTPPRRSAVFQSVLSEPILAAEVANTPEGAQAYAKTLTRIFVLPELGRAYARDFSKRLAEADLLARSGKRDLIPEDSIARTFNQMMKRITEAGANPLETDTSVVHQFRLSLQSISPYLSSVGSTGTKCLPSEAVLALYLLVSNGGAVTKIPPGARSGSVRAEAPGGPSGWIPIYRFIETHDRSKLAELYEDVAKNLDL